MDAFEQKRVLESMEVLVDTREQDTYRALKRYKSFEVPWRRATLNFGDYTYNFRINDSDYYNTDETIVPKFCVVERKMDLDELAQCFTRSRQRFSAEFDRAKESGCRIYLLVENGSWDALLKGEYRTKVLPHVLLASCVAFMARYNAQLVFCEANNSGRMIKEILYRDLKERLERGDIDWQGSSFMKTTTKSEV